VRRAAAAALALACAGLATGCAASAGAEGGPATGGDGEPGAARSGPFVLVPDSAADGVAVRAPAGARVRVPLRLANGAGAPRAFALSASAAWIAVPARVEVPPRASVPVAAALTVPASAPPGRVHRARVIARAGGRPGAAVAVRYESSVPVTVRVVARVGA
jgi:hypothetical protein